MKSALVAFLGFCLLLTGCTTTRNISLTSPAAGVRHDVVPGDTVVITLKSGEIRRMKVESFDATTLTGRTLDSPRNGTISQVALANVQSLQVRRVNGWRTGALAVGVVAAVGVVVVGALIIAQCGTHGNCDDD